MANNRSNSYDGGDFFLESSKDTSTGGGKLIISKFEDDLFYDEDNIKMPVIRVRHFNLAAKQERWKIFSDNKIVFVVEGSKLNKKERLFLRGLDGINFLIGQQKAGIRSFSALKTALQHTMKARAIDKK